MEFKPGDRVEVRQSQSYWHSPALHIEWVPATFCQYESIPGVCRVRFDGIKDPIETVVAKLRPRNALDRLAEET